MKQLINRTPLSPASWSILFLLMFSASWVSAEPSPINGAEVFNNNCTRCHNARSLDEFSLEEWAVIMPHMREKAHLTGKETDAVMQFVALVKNDIGESNTFQNNQPTLSGKALFTKYSCQGYHSIKGKGGSVGPALDSIVGSKSEEFFIQKLKNPQFNNPSSPMPKMPLSDEEIEALADYLSTF
jgi:mono/diheme cytochrome c family protein